VLSDREREALNEIERQLAVEDPGFSRTFHAVGQSPPYNQVRLAYAVTIVVAIVLGLIVLLAGSVLGALVFAAVAGGVAVAWYCHGDKTSG